MQARLVWKEARRAIAMTQSAQLSHVDANRGMKRQDSIRKIGTVLFDF